MTLPESLWMTFLTVVFPSEGRAFNALRNQHRPYCAHMLFDPPGWRHAIRSETTMLISLLLELEHEYIE